MGFNVSPGVYTTEIDLTTVIPSVATTEAGFAGVFRWGPVGQRVLVDTEKKLAERFGKPSNLNAETFFTAANFLSYSNKLYVVRAANTSANSTDIANAALTAVGLTTGTASNTQLATSTVKTADDYETKTFDAGVFYIGKYPGALGNSLKVSTVETAAAFNSTVSLIPNTDISSVSTAVSYTVGSNTAAVLIVPSGSGTSQTTQAVGTTVKNSVSVGDFVKAGNNSIGTQYLQVTAVSTPVIDGANASLTISFSSPYTLATAYSANNVVRYWEFFNKVNKAPGQTAYQAASGNTAANDEVHVVVSDEDGLFTGTPGTVLEVFEGLSRATDAKSDEGATIYYKNVVNSTSAYVWSTHDFSTGASNTATNVASSSAVVPAALSLQGGQDGQNENAVPLSVIATAFDKFASAEEIDISIILQGVAKGGSNGTGLANYLISNIADVRKDCVVVISPEKADVVYAAGLELERVLEFRSSLTGSSYGILDSGYKYTYDKYNDEYRWVPLNGDIGGVIARTDSLADPWFSPGGATRGGIKNVYRLAWAPSQADRDQLYKADVNPVIFLPGQGPVLYGDKTLLGRPSAFDRINVRRLFIVLEKAIARASAALLFEINDEFSRALFRNMVEPFLREIQGRRGIYDFRVVCDETNNTPEVIDTNGFAGDIYVKPARSINTIQLNFIAARTGVEFSEIVGRF